MLLVAAALVHAARHENGGLDEVSVAGLSGLLADDQHILDAEVLLVAAALLHSSRHIPGGGDPMRWTVNKLLLGAGAGADPTLIDIPGADTGEGYQTILGPNYESIGQGAYIINIDPTLWYVVEIYNNNHNDGDNLLYHTYLSKGTYSIQLRSFTNVGNGIVKLAIDGVDVTVWDTYSAAPVKNVPFLTTGVVVAASSVKLIRLKVDGKNPASSNHYMYPQAIVFWRTA